MVTKANVVAKGAAYLQQQPKHAQGDDCADQFPAEIGENNAKNENTPSATPPRVKNLGCRFHGCFRVR